VPKGVKHLLVAGKCVGNGYSVRSSVTCAAMGYSCGILAATAARAGVSPADLDLETRRNALTVHGVLLRPVPHYTDMTDYIMPGSLGVPYWDKVSAYARTKKLS